MNNLLNYIKFRICSSTNFQQIKAIQNCNIEKLIELIVRFVNMSVLLEKY